MARLDQLPAELLLHITSLIIPHHDLVSFARVNRTTYNLVTNKLRLRRKYRRIRFRANIIKDLYNAFHILMAVLRRPQLGEYIRYIEIDRPPNTIADYEIRNVDLKKLDDDKDYERLRKAVREAGFTGHYGEKVINMVLQPYEPRTRWPTTRQGRLRGAWITQALAALLISVSPYLETVAVSTIFWRFTGHRIPNPHADNQVGRSPAEVLQFPVEKLFIDTNANPLGKHYLQYLRNLEIINHKGSPLDDGRFYQDYDFLGTMQLVDNLPSIERVGIDALFEDENGAPYPTWKSSNFSRIRIQNSNVGTRFLTVVMNACKVLREFNYGIGGRGSLDGSFAAFNPRIFLKAILVHKYTLEILNIDADEDCHYVSEEGPDYDQDFGHNEGELQEYFADQESFGFSLKQFVEQTGSLRDFTALTHLSIGVRILFCLARGSQSMDMEDFENITPFDQLNLAESLPPNLESLCLRGYKKGVREDFDNALAQFMTEKDEKLPNLKEVTGIEECIENAFTVRDPDGESELLWKREREEWTAYESE